MKNTFKAIRYTLYVSCFLWFLWFYILLANPILFGVKKEILLHSSDPSLLEKHISYLTQLEEQRTYKNIKSLDSVADYIYSAFEASWCDIVTFQWFTIQENEYKNVICKFTGNSREKIVIWAHYDVDAEHTHDKYEDTSLYKWADDNASWVAGILELSRLIWKDTENLKNDIEIVAYTLEEPPFFATAQMWSYVHAESLFESHANLKYMISLEMIWYFSDEDIQKYPINFLSWFYPKQGNYIAVIWELFDFNIKNVKKNMRIFSDIETHSLSAPRFITGVDFSDHRNYWKFWYRAYMITDTSFYRNENYHTINDTIDTLDFEKMKEVVNGVYWYVMNG